MADFKKGKSRNIRKRRKSSDSESDSAEEENVVYGIFFILWQSAFYLMWVVYSTNCLK